MVNNTDLPTIMQYVNQKSIVFIGCGGNIEEWVNGVSNIYLKFGIFKGCKRKFHKVYVFHDGLKRNLVFDTSFGIDHNRLEQWMQSNRIFKCSWLYDYAEKKGLT